MIVSPPFAFLVPLFIIRAIFSSILKLKIIDYNPFAIFKTHEFLNMETFSRKFRKKGNLKNDQKE
jgi:hypothetical protein